MASGDNDPFSEAAQPGGKHHGFYRRYKNAPSILIQKAIRSLRSRATEHEDKIAHPEQYIPDFRDMDTRRQNRLIHHIWPGEIALFEEQIAVLEGILSQREE